MARIDRYVYAQLLAVFGFAAMVLIAVYWVNRAIGLLDSLVGDGQSFGVFMHMSLLSIPNIIELITPTAAFGAGLFVAHKLSNESELVVLQATGFSYFRLVRPAVYFCLTVTILTAIVTNFLMPAAAEQRRALTAEIARNTTAKYLKEGQFLQPNPGIVLYIRAISDAGELEDVFISDTRDTAREQIYTAQRAYVVNDAGEPKLLMLDGQVQQKSISDGILTISKFSDITYSLASLINDSNGGQRSLFELNTLELMRGRPNEGEMGQMSFDSMQYRGHMRMSWPISAGLTALIGFSAMIIGGFSRQGSWKQIVLSIGLLVVMYLAHILTLSEGQTIRGGWVLAYLTPLLGVIMTAGLLWSGDRTRNLYKVNALNWRAVFRRAS